MPHSSPDFMRLLVLRMLVLAGAVMAVFLLLTSADAEEPPAPAVSHVVAAGDSLWNLAASVAPDGADLRRVVDEIRDLNGLDDAVIYPGQRLLLPSS